MCGLNVPVDGPECAEHNGQTYYFHAAECRREFEQSPGRYAGPLQRRTD